MSTQDLLISDIPVPLHMYHFLPVPHAQEQQILCQARQHTDKWPSETLGRGCLVLKYCKDTVAVAALSGSQNFNSFFCPRPKHQLLFSCDENLSLYLHSTFSRKPVTFSQAFFSTTVHYGNCLFSCHTARSMRVLQKATQKKPQLHFICWLSYFFPRLKASPTIQHTA